MESLSIDIRRHQTITNRLYEIVYFDKNKYYDFQSKLFQEYCEISWVRDKLTVLYRFRDCGVRNISTMGLALKLTTNSNECISNYIESYVEYTHDNELTVRFLFSPNILISFCQIKIAWIHYTRDDNGERTWLTSHFETPTKDDLKKIQQITKIRSNGLVKNGNCKSPISIDKVSFAWQYYDELKQPFHEIELLISSIKSHHLKLIPSTSTTEYSTNKTISVPINCYFDKGFYASIYYVQELPVSFTKFSSGGSSIQCVVEVNKNDLDLLLYLYYCTISSRNYFQYMTLQQRQFKEYVETNHPVEQLKVQLDAISKKFDYLDIIEGSDVWISARKIVADYYDQLKTLRDNAYMKLEKNHKIHGKWSSEMKLFSLVNAIFPDAIYQYSANWLGNQTLDIFIPTLKCGIEYQGKQHYAPDNFFGGEVGFSRQVHLDMEKKRKCSQQGVTLLEWSYQMQITLSHVCTFLRQIAPDEYFYAKSLENHISNLSIKSMSYFLEKMKC